MMENLKGILNNVCEGTLYYDVANDLMDCYDNNEDFIAHVKDVLNCGCQSGIVSSQIYYKDTYKFFEKHMDEIFDMYNELKSEIGDFMKELSPNNLSWLAYEETTRNIAHDLGIEY